jgi:lactoylglutathione lyase
MAEERKARAVGFNHVALEVGDIEEALAFYDRLFEFKLRGKSSTSAFIDLGDQFLALQRGRTQHRCLLCARKRTFFNAVSMSAKCQ